MRAVVVIPVCCKTCRHEFEPTACLDCERPYSRWQPRTPEPPKPQRRPWISRGLAARMLVALAVSVFGALLVITAFPWPVR